MLTRAYSFKLLFAYNLMFGLCYYKIAIYNILLKTENAFEQNNKNPRAQNNLQRVADTTTIQRYYFLLGQVLFLTCHIIGKKR